MAAFVRYGTCTLESIQFPEELQQHMPGAKRRRNASRGHRYAQRLSNGLTFLMPAGSRYVFAETIGHEAQQCSNEPLGGNELRGGNGPLGAVVSLQVGDGSSTMCYGDVTLARCPFVDCGYLPCATSGPS